MSEPAAPPDGGGLGLGARAAKGAFVSVGGQALKAAIQMVGLVILARLLSPEDYGLVALTAVVVGIGEIFRDFGLSTAAVQARTLSAEQRGNLFWINLGIGCVLAAVVAGLVAPLVAWAMDAPALADVMRLLALTFVLNGAATQYRASLERALRFKRIALLDALAPLAGLVVAISLAVGGAGVWALVAQQLTTGGVLLVLLVWSGGWLPGAPRRGVDMGGMLRFGWNLVGNQLVGYAANNVDSLLIGWRFGLAPLGLYNRAFQLLMQPYNQVRVPITKVAIPILSRLQGQEERYWAFLLRGQIALGYTLSLGLLLVAGSARPLTSLLLGERWIEAAPLLALLAIAATLQSLAGVGYWVYVTRGLTGHLFTWSLISATIKISFVAAGSFFGLLGVATGYMLAPLVAWPLSFLWLARRVELPLRSIFSSALRIALVGGLAGSASWVMDHLMASQPDALAIVANSVTGLAVAACALALPAVRRDVLALRDTVALLRA